MFGVYICERSIYLYSRYEGPGLSQFLRTRFGLAERSNAPKGGFSTTRDTPS